MNTDKNRANSLESMLLSELESGEYTTQTLYEAVLRACQTFEPGFNPAKSQTQDSKAPIVININQ